MESTRTELLPRQRAPISAKGWLRMLVGQRSVQLAALIWVAANALILAMGHGAVPFDRPSLGHQSFTGEVVSANETMLEIFFQMGIVYLLTRRRTIPDLAARAPAMPRAWRETLGLIGYGVAAQLGGLLVGRALGWHAFSFHIIGTLFGTDQRVTKPEVFCWAIYNVIAYAIVPFLVFRRRYSAEQLSLRSSNRCNDLLVIIVVLAVESTVQLLAVSSAILDLAPRQILLGAPLTFALYFLGTVLPTMIFIYCILAPRYLKLTGSVPTTVILGGVTYAALHFFDGWTSFQTPRDAVLSVFFLFLMYFGPGMFKMVATLRTGNAWVHVWAYHAIAPHTLMDTPFIVKVFRIR